MKITFANSPGVFFKVSSVTKGKGGVDMYFVESNVSNISVDQRRITDA